MRGSRVRRGRSAALWLALLAWASAGTALAQEPLTASDFNLDAVNTPALGSSRIVGLGGAYAALATGVDGAAFNPAAYGSRSPYELDHFEWEIAFSIFFPGVGGLDDFFNSGGGGLSTSAFQFFDVGGRLQLGNVGFGALLRALVYRVPAIIDFGAGPEVVDFDVSLVTTYAGLGYSLLDGELVIGGGARLVNFAIGFTDPGLGGAPRVEVEPVGFTGSGPEVGALWRPAGLPIRLGAALRTAVVSQAVDPERDSILLGATPFYRPNQVRLPWEVQVGAAVQLGPRPFNLRYLPLKDAEGFYERQLRLARCQREAEVVRTEMLAEGRAPPSLMCPNLPQRARDPAFHAREAARRSADEEETERLIEAAEEQLAAEREELYASLARRYLLLSGQITVIGPTTDGVGLDAYVRQQRVPRGEDVSVGVALGAEAEPVHGRLKLRAGTYYEPARQQGRDGRIHGTFGFDLNIVEVFGYEVRGTFTIDGAARFLDVGAGVGIWH